MTEFRNQTFDAERSLYGLRGAQVENCVFSGPADGESPLKECSSVTVSGCTFDLRYPFWHVTTGNISDCVLSEKCRAPLWYDNNITMSSCRILGVKAFRECNLVRIDSTEAVSEEFGWKCRNITLKNVNLTSVYPFFECSNMDADNLTMTGKYSFQYTNNITISNSHLTTKDAFWHSNNVTVTDSVIEGEYLAWYSNNLRLVRCEIRGTQPFCYATNLTLENCTLVNCDLAFEKSRVNADILGNVTSIKNPLRGKITVDSVDEIIMDDPEAKGKIIIRGSGAVKTKTPAYPPDADASEARNIPPMLCVYMGPPAWLREKCEAEQTADDKEENRENTETAPDNTTAGADKI